MVEIKTDFLKSIKGFKKFIGNNNNSFSSFGYDSRMIKEGELFFAFKTNKNDGNDYIAEAIRKGAKGYIGQKEVNNLRPWQTGIIVEDTFKFLYEMAKNIIDSSKAKIIALTGSAGKTSTKEFLYEILKYRGKTFKTPKNYNSDIGVPLSIISGFEKDTEIAIFELGTNRYGEIKDNSLLIKPDIAAILNVLNTHLEFLTNLEGVLKVKTEIFAGLKPNGIAVLNYDNDYTRKAGDAHLRKLFFGEKEGADIKFDIIKQDIGGSIIKLNYKGESIKINTKLFLTTHIKNLIAASSLAIAYGCDFESIQKGIKDIKPQKHRGQIIKHNNCFILDDSYNSNYDAVKLILDDFAKIQGKKIVILGEIFEMGEKSKDIHLKLAEIIKKYRFDIVYLIRGDISYTFEELKKEKFYRDRVYFYDSVSDFKERFFSLIKESSNILIKGSHGTGLYKLTEELNNV